VKQENITARYLGKEGTVILIRLLRINSLKEGAM
jgi:hypothetical protein